MHVITSVLLFLCLVSVAPSAWAGSKPAEDTGKQHSWFSFNRPSKEDPAAQLEYARQLQAEGRLRKAGRAYRALADTWPGSPQAVTALYARAQTLDARGKHEDAFEAYDKVATTFNDGYPYADLLKRQFELAQLVMKEKKGRFLLFGGFQAPERAIPLFEGVVKNGPYSPYAAEAQYLMARAYELSDQWELAVAAYMPVQPRYPASVFAEKSAFGRAHALYQLADESPNDEEALEQAWAGVVLYLNRYPEGSDAGAARTYRETLLGRRAQMAYDKAHFYEKVAHRPEAARKAYESFLQRFPNSEWAAPARDRLARLTSTKD